MICQMGLLPETLRLLRESCCALATFVNVLLSKYEQIFSPQNVASFAIFLIYFPKKILRNL